MSIPVISDIIDGVKWIIDFFMNKLPRPLKFLIFLLLLLSFAQLIPFFLHMVGIHCKSDKVVVKVDTFDIFANYGIYKEQSEIVVGENLTFEEVHPKIDPDNCYWYMINDNGYVDRCIDFDDPLCKYYYRWGQWFDCNRVRIIERDWFLWFDNENTYCEGDVLSQDNFGASPADKDCFVPNGYTWSFDDGYYYCINSTICGANVTDGFSIIDEKLENLDYIPMYEKGLNEKSYKNAIKLKCDNELNPQITFFGIEIFNFQLWILLTLMGVMVLFFTKMRPHKRF